MKYVALYSLCSTRGIIGLGSSLSMKHLPLGRTNLLGFRELVFSTGFTGAMNPSIISELQNGKVGSISADLTADTVKCEVFLDLTLGTVWVSALGLLCGCLEISHRCAAGGGNKPVTVLAASHISPAKIPLVEVLDEQGEYDGMGTGVLPSGGEKIDPVTVVAVASHGSPTKVLGMGVLDEHSDTTLDNFLDDETTTFLSATSDVPVFHEDSDELVIMVVVGSQLVLGWPKPGIGRGWPGIKHISGGHGGRRQCSVSPRPNLHLSSSSFLLQNLAWWSVLRAGFFFLQKLQ